MQTNLILFNQPFLGPLPGLRWDLVEDNDDPIVDNRDSEEYNLDRFLETFTKNAKAYSVGYPTRNILIPMGEDFQYMAAGPFYKNMDKLIKATANHTSVKVFYSTASCYAKALADSKVSFSSKTDDFFPYASDAHSYWTGYFTSRAALKKLEREGAAVMAAVKMVDVFMGKPHRFEKEINALREIMGVMQHHDAVTGTEKQAVSNDYTKGLSAAISGCQNAIGQSLRALFNGTAVGGATCLQLNVSSCPVSEGSKHFTVTLLSANVAELINTTVRLPVKEGVSFEVTDLVTKKKLTSALVPVPEAVQRLPERKGSAAKMELVVEVPSIPPLGFFNFAVKQVGVIEVTKPSSAANTVLRGRTLAVHFDANGEISKVERLVDNSSVSFKNEFYFYKGIEDPARNSGAYIFRPADQKPTKAGHVVEATLHGDHLFSEVHQKYSVDWISQIVRLDTSGPEDALEFEWTVGPIPVADKVGRELVTRYVTDIASGDTFKTDANARQLLTRKVNFRPSWKLSVTEPVSGNYYPINSKLILEDERPGKLSMAVLNDRSQGGTSMTPGTAELMIHRRLLHLDGKGVSFKNVFIKV